MLSYRHSFHAGNHADVLKHLVLVELLTCITARDKPFWYIDTHAGAGLYDLKAPPGAGRPEFEDGIGRLWSSSNGSASIAKYLDLVRRLNPGKQLRVYPGSPWFARELARPDDRLWLFELHPADYGVLAEGVAAADRRVRAAPTDGFDGLRGLLPPQPRRALVMIDPSYELAADYNAVTDSVAGALRRFATGIYAIWYPCLQARDAQQMPSRLRKIAGPRWLDARLTVGSPPGERPGLYGSGVFVINPPHTLPAALADALPVLAATLGRDDSAGSRLDFEIP